MVDNCILLGGEKNKTEKLMMDVWRFDDEIWQVHMPT